MAKRLLTVSLAFVWLASILSAAPKKERIEIHSEQLKGTKDEVVSEGEALVYYGNRVIHVGEVRYDKKQHTLFLKGSVEIIDEQGNKTRSEAVEIDTKSKEVRFTEMILFSQKDMWILSQDAIKEEEYFRLGRSYVSSCNISDPVWQINFDRSKYESKEKYLQLYHAWVYLSKIPIFYTPYLAFPVDNTRRSGVLFPMFGYTQNEGVLYEQPIFWAIAPNIDIEFNPQIRTKRGEGLFSSLRFVPSADSRGWVSLGYFKDKEAFQKAEGNSEVRYYGLQAEYDNQEFFFQNHRQYQDGLYLYLDYLNHIEYQNLQKTDLGFYVLSPLQESKLNYFLQNDRYYAGMNVKYFIDTRQESNSETIQQLPSFTWHQYLDRLFTDHLLYGIDIRTDRFDRHEGARYRHYGINLPVEWQELVLYDYLQLSLKQQLRHSRYVFSNGEFPEETYKYTDYRHTFRVSSDLSRYYGEKVHVIQPSLAYVMPGDTYDGGVSYEDLDREQQSLFSIGLPRRHLDLALGQYWYSSSGRLIWYQRIGQLYFPERSQKLDTFHHEMEYRYGKLNFYSDIYYSHQFHKIPQSSTLLSLSGSRYSGSIGYSYKKEYSEGAPPVSRTDDLNLRASYQWGERYDIEARMLYGFIDQASKLWSVGVGYAKDCWSLRLDLREDLRPATSEEEADRETRVYIQFDFRPFGGIRTGAQI